MAVDLTKSGISVGVGVVDTVLERLDANENRTETFKKWSDLARLAGAIAGYGIQMLYPRQAKIGEAIALSATPLLVKTLAEGTIADMLKAEGAGAFTPTRTRTPAREPAPAGYSRSNMPEFDLTRLL